MNSTEEIRTIAVERAIQARLTESEDLITLATNIEAFITSGSEAAADTDHEAYQAEIARLRAENEAYRAEIARQRAVNESQRVEIQRLGEEKANTAIADTAIEDEGDIKALLHRLRNDARDADHHVSLLESMLRDKNVVNEALKRELAKRPAVSKRPVPDIIICPEGVPCDTTAQEIADAVVASFKASGFGD